ncbi:hypothetical protein [Roseateles koreensis]|uniref:Uncharacterized protein n=1 Tax=Roseateles koreensis TaxID=2987526 RepID=A0ABT5KV61_9BURK|nr:hypothetical protein [Roseateles koreensis]MDC8786819.1 hypothetical protein [Roseateles koreensis]
MSWALSHDAVPPPPPLVPSPFWDPGSYAFNSATDWNQWKYVSDGLGGTIGVKYGVSAGYSTWDGSAAGVQPMAPRPTALATAPFRSLRWLSGRRGIYRTPALAKAGLITH